MLIAAVHRSCDKMGTVFLEDVVGRWFKFSNQNVWARQFNVEGDGTHISNQRRANCGFWATKLKATAHSLETREGGVHRSLGRFELHGWR